MPPEITYIVAAVNTIRDRHRGRARDAGLTTLEAIIWAAGLAVLATAVIAAITIAVNHQKAKIK